MDFVELPVHLNCQHFGIFSPVLFRFEGGNDRGGFCIEEYHEKKPMVTLYGDLKDARHCWAKLFDRLNYITYSLNNPAIIEYNSEGCEWFLFDCRLPDRRIIIHEGATAFRGCVLCHSDSVTATRQDVRDALERVEAIFRNFYNV